MTKEERRDKFLREHSEWKYEYKKKELAEKICLKCANIFMQCSFSQKYCSKNCYAKIKYGQDREKQNVRWKVWWAVKNRKMVKSLSCEKCTDKTTLQGHHKDYSKPLDVEWLCMYCHKEADKLLK